MLSSKILKNLEYRVRLLTFFCVIPCDWDPQLGKLIPTKYRARLKIHKIISWTMFSMFIYYSMCFGIEVYFIGGVPIHVLVQNLTHLFLMGWGGIVYFLSLFLSRDAERKIFNLILHSHHFLQGNWINWWLNGKILKIVNFLISELIFTQTELKLLEKKSKPPLFIPLSFKMEIGATIFSLLLGTKVFYDEFGLLRRYIYNFINFCLGGTHSYFLQIPLLLFSIFYIRYLFALLSFPLIYGTLYLDSMLFWLEQLAENEMLKTKSSVKIIALYRNLYVLTQQAVYMEIAQITLFLFPFIAVVVLSVLNCVSLNYFRTGYYFLAFIFSTTDWACVFVVCIFYNTCWEIWWPFFKIHPCT